MERWKQQMHKLSFNLDVNDRHLSNVRFVDDMSMLAISKDSEIHIFEILMLQRIKHNIILITKNIEVVYDFDHIVLHDGSDINEILIFECYR